MMQWQRSRVKPTLLPKARDFAEPNDSRAEIKAQNLPATLAQFSPVSVHAASNGVSAVAKVNAIAAVPKAPRECHILENFRCHRCMSSDRVVSAAADENILAIR